MPDDRSDSVPIAVDVRDSAGALTTAGSVTLTIPLPDGTTATPTVTNPPTVTGEYRYTYVPVQVGQHAWRFVPFQAPQWWQRQVSAAMGPISGKKRFAEMAALHDQQTARSASLVTPQGGQSQLGGTFPPSLFRRSRQSRVVKAKVARNRKRSAVGRRLSTTVAMSRLR